MPNRSFSFHHTHRTELRLQAPVANAASNCEAEKAATCLIEAHTPRYSEGSIHRILASATNVERYVHVFVLFFERLKTIVRVPSLTGSSSSRSRWIGIRHGTGAGKGKAAGALPHPENPRVSRREGRDETAEIRLRRGPRGRPPRHHHSTTGPASRHLWPVGAAGWPWTVLSE